MRRFLKVFNEHEKLFCLKLPAQKYAGNIIHW